MADRKINRTGSRLVDSRIAADEDIAGKANVHFLTSNEDPLAGIKTEFMKKEY
jgi:hypothetical protein